MAEETVHLIEECEEEIKDWIYYSKQPSEDECSNLDSFTDEVTGTQLIYMDSSSVVVHNNDQFFEYDTIDNTPENNHNDQDVIEEQETSQTCENVSDSLKHNLILRETIDENGLLIEEYFCEYCNQSYKSIEDFVHFHPNVELLDENTEEHQQKSEEKPKVCEDKLWDLVENLDEVENGVYQEIENDEEGKPSVAPEYENDDCAQYDNIDTDAERYFCYDCQQVFTDLLSAENHECSHQIENAKEFKEIDPAVMTQDDADNSVYRCDACNQDYTSLRSFNNHQRWHKKCENIESRRENGGAAVCEICNTIFASEKNLKLHMKMHKKHPVKTIQEALPVGAQNEYNELNKFFCEICNKSFDQRLLVIHKNMHQNVEEYSCGKCNKQFENLPSYEVHMQMHADNVANVKKVNSSKKVNDLNFSEDTPSTSSQGSIGSSGKRKHACQYCGKEFLRPYEKVKHERVHTGEKPYECEVCGKTFRVSYSLTLHLRTHTDIRPYVCATCNKRFKQQSVYVHHLKTHDVERAYKCDICGKSFRTSVQLSGHKNIHSKPYNCTECNRPFASLYAVKIHMKTHNKGHKSNKNLKNSCSICGASYARVFALRYHMKEQHGIDVDPIKLLTATDSNTNADIDAETALLMNVAHEASNYHFITGDEDDEDNEVDSEAEGMFPIQVDQSENIRNRLQNNVYLDETEAATQTILNTEETTNDNFPAEEIITDWLSK